MGLRYKVKIWWRAMFLDYPHWRVEYTDGRRTRLLHKHEAKGLSECFDGRLYVEYNIITTD